MTRRRELHDVDDAVLVQLVAVHGDEVALTVLIDRHTGWARRVAYRAWADPFIAADAVTDAFIEFWKAPERIDPARGTFRAWLRAVVRYKAFDLARSASRHEGTMPLLDDEGEEWGGPGSPGADVVALAGIIGDAVGAALSRLPARQREVLVLAYVDGLSTMEIAAFLGVPRTTVSARLFNARENLRHLVVELRRAEDRPEQRRGKGGDVQR